MSTYPGFPLAALETPPAMEVWKALKDIDLLVQSYKKGEFEIPPSDKDPIIQAVLVALPKHSEPTLIYAMKMAGSAAFVDAMLEMAGFKSSPPA